MDVFEWFVLHEYWGLDLRDPDQSLDVYHSLAASPREVSWTALSFVAMPDPDRPNPLVGDTLQWTNRFPLISERARLALEPILSRNAQSLPIDTPFGRYHIVNVTRLVPALIESASQMFRYPSGRIVEIERYALDPTFIGDTPLFKLTQWPDGRVLVTKPFIEAVEKSNLTGFGFKRVWPTPIDLNLS